MLMASCTIVFIVLFYIALKRTINMRSTMTAYLLLGIRIYPKDYGKEVIVEEIRRGCTEHEIPEGSKFCPTCGREAPTKTPRWLTVPDWDKLPPGFKASILDDTNSLSWYEIGEGSWNNALDIKCHQIEGTSNGVIFLGAWLGSIDKYDGYVDMSFWDIPEKIIDISEKLRLLGFNEKVGLHFLNVPA